MAHGLITCFVYAVIFFLYYYFANRADDSVPFSEFRKCANAEEPTKTSKEAKKAVEYFQDNYTAKNKRYQIIAKWLGFDAGIGLLAFLAVIPFVDNRSPYLWCLEVLGIVSGTCYAISLMLVIPWSAKRNRLRQLQNIVQIFGAPEERAEWVQSMQRTYHSQLNRMIPLWMVPYGYNDQFALSDWLIGILLNFGGFSLVMGILVSAIDLACQPNPFLIRLVASLTCFFWLILTYPTRVRLFGKWAGTTKSTIRMQVMVSVRDVQASLPDEPA